MADLPTIHILKRPSRIWAVAAIHGEAERLAALHDALAQHAREGDRLIYLGNMIGYGEKSKETVDELLDFRTRFIGRQGMFACDIAYLRGQQEEMWHKLLQLQFAPDPPRVFDFMMKNGVKSTVEAYGGSILEGRNVASQGPVAITKWTSALRSSFKAAPGHTKFLASVRRACHDDNNQFLFVSAGIDPKKPLSNQGDQLWWGGQGFDSLTKTYEPYKKIIRGFDTEKKGFDDQEHKLTIDDGCGFGGPLTSIALTAEGQIDIHLEI